MTDEPNVPDRVESLPWSPAVDRLLTNAGWGVVILAFLMIIAQVIRALV